MVWKTDSNEPDVKNALANGTGAGINTDAWGSQKVSQDKSILHGMFTSSIPADTWKESLDGVEQISIINAQSVNGQLVLTSRGNLNEIVKLSTFRHPRYQPNRGHHYAVSLFLPNITAQGQRDFGIFTAYAGVFFRLKSDGQLYAVRRTTENSTTSEVEELITTQFNIDLTMGNIFDIQMQWRGVGNIFFYIGDPVTGVSQKVHTMSLLGTLDGLSIFNPALPIAYACVNLGDDVTIKSGCVDVSSEGGDTDENKLYGSVSIDNESGQVAISGYNVPILVVKSLSEFNGSENTRDIQALLVTAYSDQRSMLRVWATRDESAITLNDQEWVPFGDGNLEYIEYNNPPVGSAMEFDQTKASLTFGGRVDQDTSLSTTALFQGVTRIYQSPGDIFIFTMHRENGGNCIVGATYEFAQEI